MRRIRSIPFSFRPREKLQKSGPASLSLTELLCVILSSGKKATPVNIIATRVARLIEDGKVITIEKLRTIGIGPAKATQIVAAIELAHRLGKTQRKSFTKPDHIYAQCYDIVREDKETILCFYFNARGDLLKREKLAVGGLNKAHLLPREIFHLVKDLPVASIVLAHNHPSGVADPSAEDVLFTKRVKAAGDILGVKLLDHLVVTKEGWKQIAY